jgi:hypothetical protein
MGLRQLYLLHTNDICLLFFNQFSESLRILKAKTSKVNQDPSNLISKRAGWMDESPGPRWTA